MYKFRGKKIQIWLIVGRKIVSNISLEILKQFLDLRCQQNLKLQTTIVSKYIIV